MDPKGSQIRVLSGSSIAFGLTEGGAQSPSVAVTPLARRILRAREEGDDLKAKREALLLPRVFGEFLRQYDGSSLPRQDIAENVLEELGVPRDKATDVFERICSSAEYVGFIEEIKGKKYVALHGATAPLPPADDGDEEPDPNLDSDPEPRQHPLRPDLELAGPPAESQASEKGEARGGAVLSAAIADDKRRRRVFITHGKNRDLVEPIRKLLEYGELEPVVSVEKQTVSKPVPEKVMDDMRGCGAAIIHVDADRTFVDADGNKHEMLNPNVLIEIGAAMAFYRRRFILLVRDGVKLPSNLQGLYEVRYQGDTLDANATIKLLEAIKDTKNYGLPAAPGEI